MELTLSTFLIVCPAMVVPVPWNAAAVSVVFVLLWHLPSDTGHQGYAPDLSGQRLPGSGLLRLYVRDNPRCDSVCGQGTDGGLPLLRTDQGPGLSPGSSAPGVPSVHPRADEQLHRLLQGHRSLLHRGRDRHGILSAGNAHGNLIARRDQFIPLHRGDKGIPQCLAVLFDYAPLRDLAGRQFSRHFLFSNTFLVFISRFHFFKSSEPDSAQF